MNSIFPRDDPEHGTHDISKWLPQALDDIVDTLLTYRQYPGPRTRYVNGRRERVFPRIRFDLEEWIANTYEPSELVSFFALLVCDYGFDADDIRLTKSNELEAALREHLSGSQLVNDRAEEMYQADLEDRRNDYREESE